MSYFEMPFWRQFLLLYEDCFLSSFILLIYLYPLFDKVSIQRHLKKFLLFFLLPLAVVAVYRSIMGTVKNMPLLYLISIFILLLFTLWSMFLWQYSFWQSLSVVCIAGMLQSAMCTICKHLLHLFFPLRELETANPDVLFWLTCFTLPVHFALSKALKHLRLGERFRVLLEEAGSIRRTALLFFALASVFVVLSHLQYVVNSQDLAEYLVIVAALILLAVMLTFHLAQRDIDRRQMQVQQEVIARHQIYEQGLEELRQEMQMFQHDYKNLLTGFAQNAENRELCRGFDRRLGEKIQVYSQIDNLRILQARSLLLGKMALMSEQGIECRLEVLYPVERVEMETWDFIRCLGILVDNAIEAASEMPQPWVEIILLQTEDTFTLRVSNPWNREINRTGIWKKGWSTKGRGRGLGLFSYQRILQRYPEASHVTSWGDGVFVQELTIGGL